MIGFYVVLVEEMAGRLRYLGSVVHPVRGADLTTKIL
jgi:hypothetical protein